MTQREREEKPTPPFSTDNPEVKALVRRALGAIVNTGAEQLQGPPVPPTIVKPSELPKQDPTKE